MSTYFKIILIVSLALNILFSGMIFGHISHRVLWQNASYRARMELASQLPEDKRKLFKDAMHNVWMDTESIRAQMADAKTQAARLLKADPFNEDAYLTQVQHINDLHAQMRRHMAQAMAALARQFTPEERAILADIISHPPSDNQASHEKEDKN